MIGVFDPERRIHGMAGLLGLGNSYSNVGAAHLAARIAGAGDGLAPPFLETLQLLLAAGPHRRPLARYRTYP